MDENDLIRSAKEGEVGAYNQIVVMHQDVAYSYAYSILQDPQAAEDCTQDGFLRAYLHLHDFRGGSFRAYIFRIVRNTCYDELRRNKRRAFFTFSSSGCATRQVPVCPLFGGPPGS
jgi:RNA polymerase sigma-70 factor (ECF subfamily)